MKNNMVNYFSFRKIKRTADYCGCTYSLKRYIFTMLGMAALAIFAGEMFKLRPAYIAVIVIVGLCGVPSIIRRGFVIRHDEQLHSDIDMYLHQMVYSFMRQPKIINALKDTAIVSSEKLKASVNEALDELRYGVGDNVFETSMSIIEDTYKNPRIKALNRFMMEVERSGGRYRKSMEVLFEDNDKWVNRRNAFSKDIILIKRDISIGIIISVMMAYITTLISGMLNRYSESSMSLYSNEIYQISTMVFILVCLLFFFFIHKSYNVAMFTEGNSQQTIMRDYKLIMSGDKNSELKVFIPGVLLLMIAGGCLMYFGHLILSLYAFFAALVILFMPFIKKNAAKKRLNREANFAFTQWLRGVALNLQGNTLQTAIEKSVNDCPFVMQNSLEEFVSAINADPTDIRPYYDFMEEFKSKDISAMTRMLYSITTVEDESVEDTINLLIKRNYEMMEKYEKERIEDKKSVMRFQEYIPALFAAFKIGIDMMLVVTMYL